MNWQDQPEAFLRSLFERAVASAQPMLGLRSLLPEAPPAGKTIVLGAGKAAGAMAHAFELAVQQRWPAGSHVEGIVVTRYGHQPPRPAELPPQPRIEILEAAHPVPDANSEAAARRILALAAQAGPDDLVVYLLSGGGSALLALPADGIDMALKQHITGQLLQSGAPIEVINCVRKHLSGIKGGRLAQASATARRLTIAISDVPGDDLSVIASGPTVPDASNCAEALAWIDHYGIGIPESLRERLQSATLETPKPGEPLFQHDRHLLMATPAQALRAAAELAEEHGLPAFILSDRLEGESSAMGRWHAQVAHAVQAGNSSLQAPCVLLSGGETTVTITRTDVRAQGGRAMEFCMGLARGLQGAAGIWGLAADTDGIDGISDAAGAQVTPSTLERARAAGLDLPTHMHAHDGHGFFDALGDLVRTGPTHTNVNDFRAILIV
ncbi:glycerate kinase [Corticibacter populi]|uniref:Glycerate kinase n=2 Tax=Corticibacter populi TaxID=1550736 RepID=A0A3M6R112_9BURK|nr:glycerate kinase [Corticibacter populi]